MFQGGRPGALLFVIESLDACNLACASDGAPLATSLLRQRLLKKKMMQVHPETAMKIKHILIGLHTRFDLLRPSIVFNGGSSLSWSLRRVSADRHQSAERHRHTTIFVTALRSHNIPSEKEQGVRPSGRQAGRKG